MGFRAVLSITLFLAPCAAAQDLIYREDFEAESATGISTLGDDICLQYGDPQNGYFFVDTPGANGTTFYYHAPNSGAARNIIQMNVAFSFGIIDCWFRVDDAAAGDFNLYFNIGDCINFYIVSLYPVGSDSSPDSIIRLVENVPTRLVEASRMMAAGQWNHLRVVRNRCGRISVFVNDMSLPHMETHDLTFRSPSPICMRLFRNGGIDEIQIRDELTQHRLVDQWFGQQDKELYGIGLDNAGDLDGDGFDDVLVGAGGIENTERGRAEVRSSRTGGVLLAWNGDWAGDNFGYNVATVGDVDQDGVPDYLIAAISGGPHDGGYARVYSGANGDLIYSYAGDSFDDRFGQPVAALGDVNADGVPDFGIGAPKDDIGHDDSGTGYVYSGASGEELYRYVGSSYQEYLGWITGKGDIDGDGVADFAIGSPGRDPGGKQNAGTVFLYSGVTGQLIDRIEGTDPGDGIGTSLSTSHDVDGDGHADILIGSYTIAQDGVPYSGKVFLYSGVDRSLVYSIDGPPAGEWFGRAVWLANDLDEDGIPDLLVQTTNACAGSVPSAGRLHIFSGASGAPVEELFGLAKADNFGGAIAILNDRNRDGVPELSVGAYSFESPGAILNGTVVHYVSVKHRPTASRPEQPAYKCPLHQQPSLALRH